MVLPSGSHYVALGSSFGAGPGLKPYVEGSPRKAGRSARNYAHLFAQARSLELSDVTFSGATTAELLYPGASGRASQLDAIRIDTKLVTITAGGNDVGYLPTLTYSSLPRLVRQLPSVKRAIEDGLDARKTEDRFLVLAKNLDVLVDRIHAKAPEATVVLVDYLTIVPPDGQAVAPSPSRRVFEWSAKAAGRLSRVLELGADQTGVVFLPAGAQSRDHHAWAAEPWTRRFHYSLRGGAPYHPNQAGMMAVADMLVQLFDRL